MEEIRINIGDARRRRNVSSDSSNPNETTPLIQNSSSDEDSSGVDAHTVNPRGHKISPVKKSFFEKHVHTFRFPLQIVTSISMLIYLFFTSITTLNAYSQAARDMNWGSSNKDDDVNDNFAPLRNSTVKDGVWNRFIYSKEAEVTIWFIAVTVTLFIGYLVIKPIWDAVGKLGTSLDKRVKKHRGEAYFLDKANSELLEMRHTIDHSFKHIGEVLRELNAALLKVKLDEKNTDLIPLQEINEREFKRLNTEVTPKFKGIYQLLLSDEPPRCDEGAYDAAWEATNKFSAETLTAYKALKENIETIIEENARRAKGKGILNFTHKTKELTLPGQVIKETETEISTGEVNLTTLDILKKLRAENSITSIKINTNAIFAALNQPRSNMQVIEISMDDIIRALEQQYEAQPAAPTARTTTTTTRSSSELPFISNIGGVTTTTTASIVTTSEQPLQQQESPSVKRR